MHVNSKYARSGEIIAKELLHIEDITEAVDALQTSIPGQLADQKSTLNCPDSPEIKIGLHCSFSLLLRSQAIVLGLPSRATRHRPLSGH